MTSWSSGTGARRAWHRDTLVAIERGLLEGAQVIEVDVHRTRDGHLVLMPTPPWTGPPAGAATYAT